MWRFLSQSHRSASNGPSRLRPSNGRSVWIVGGLFLSLLVALGARLVHIQVVRHEHFLKKAGDQHFRSIPIMPRRGRILDRRGEPVALSKFMNSVYMEPGRITSQRESVATRMAELFEIPYEPIFEKLLRFKDSNACVPVARKVEVDWVREKVLSLRYEFDLPPPALTIQTDSKRVYPRRDFAAHVVGGAAMDDFGDNVGREGIELKYDSYLRGNMQRFQTLSSASRQSMEPVTNEQYYSAFGNDVVLTLDSAIQSVAEKELARVVKEQMASAGVLVAMACADAAGYKRGEVLAMAVVPTFDANQSAPDFLRRNRAVTDAIETGSVMKTFLAAILLDNDLVSPEEIIDCQGGVAYFNSRRVKDTDDHVMREVPFADVFKFSSNVGCVTVAQRIAPADYADWLLRLGFGRPTGIDFPGEAPGAININYPSDRDRAAFGYSVSVTAIQVATALSLIGNEGVTVKPHLVREVRDVQGKTIWRPEPGAGRRVIKSVTAKKVLDLMEGVITEGTGKKAQIPGYRLAGKTGTVNKYNPLSGTYDSRAYISSFACLAPREAPRIAIYCYVDEPKKDKYGGAVAAPVAREVAYVAMRVMGVMPAPTNQPPDKDFELIVEPIRTERRTVTLADLATRARRDGRMPDLRGLTMAETITALASAPVELDFRGSGIVIGQNPAPDQPLASARKAVITFGKAGDPPLEQPSDSIPRAAKLALPPPAPDDDATTTAPLTPSTED